MTKEETDAVVYELKQMLSRTDIPDYVKPSIKKNY